MGIFKNILFFVVVFLFARIDSSLARPEYAVKYGIVNCTACHTSPFGGGVRNVYGKQYDEHNLGNGYTSYQDIASLDMRAIALYPAKAEQTQNGLALMEVAPTGNIPITKTGDKVDSRVVISYGLGGLAPGLREAYALFYTADEKENAWLNSLTVGKFVAPFGLLTEEHRTYTKMMTQTTENNFEMGGAISGDPHERVHYDFALTNGFQSGGAFTNNDLSYALIGNVRWNPPSMPFFVGASGALHRTLTTKSYNPYADVLYAALSLDRLTRNRLNGSIQTEVVWARGWNANPPNSNITYFIPSTQTSFMNAILDTQSFGWYLLFNYDLTSRLALVYKLDEYMPNSRYASDAFIRYGYGFKYFISSNIDILTRYEQSIAGRPGVYYTDSQAARNDFYIMMHLWL